MPLPFPAKSIAPGIGAPAPKRTPLPTSGAGAPAGKKFADGLALQTKINQSNAASLKAGPLPAVGSMASPLGRMGTMESTLPAPQAAAGLPMGTMKSTLQPPDAAMGKALGVTPPGPKPYDDGIVGGKMAQGVPSGFVGPTNAANPGPAAPLLPPPQRMVKEPGEAPEARGLTESAEPASMEPKGLPMARPDEALNQFASQELGGVEWQDKVNGAKRGRRAVGGAYNGMTEAQALNAAQEKFRRLSPQQKQAMYDRKAGLEYQPKGTTPPLRRPITDPNEALFQ